MPIHKPKIIPKLRYTLTILVGVSLGFGWLHIQNSLLHTMGLHQSRLSLQLSNLMSIQADPGGEDCGEYSCPRAILIKCQDPAGTLYPMSGVGVEVAKAVQNGSGYNWGYCYTDANGVCMGELEGDVSRIDLPPGGALSNGKLYSTLTGPVPQPWVHAFTFAYSNCEQAPPVPDFSLGASGGRGCIPEQTNTIAFPNLSSGNITSYQWDFDGNGSIELTTATPTSPSYTYLAAGVYSPRLTVTGPGGNRTKVLTNAVEIHDLPQPVINYPNGHFVPAEFDVQWGEIQMPNIGAEAGQTFNDQYWVNYIDTTTGARAELCRQADNPNQGVGFPHYCPFPPSLFESNKKFALELYVSNGSCSNHSPTYGTGSETVFTYRTDAWYQIGHGKIYADTVDAAGVAIQSKIPVSCQVNAQSGGSCIPSLYQTQGGAANRQSGLMQFGPEEPKLTNPLGQTFNLMGGFYAGLRADYGFWRARLDGFLQPLPAGGFGTNLNGIYQTRNSGSTFTIGGGPWANLSGQEVAILHEGDVYIQNNITIANGVLVLIASGNITIDTSVTRVDGLYIANQIHTDSTPGVEGDLPLALEGSFVGWGGVYLDRDLGVVGLASNATQPAEVFTYRPSMVQALRESEVLKRFKIFNYSWQEVAP